MEKTLTAIEREEVEAIEARLRELQGSRREIQQLESRLDALRKRPESAPKPTEDSELARNAYNFLTPCAYEPGGDPISAQLALGDIQDWTRR